MISVMKTSLPIHKIKVNREVNKSNTLNYPSCPQISYTYKGLRTNSIPNSKNTQVKQPIEKLKSNS